MKFVLAAALAGLPAFPQTAASTVDARADGALAIVLASPGGSRGTAFGAAVAIGANGVLLTSYRLVKDARSVQVRLKTGEIFDQAQLLGTDARRDVAAIRMTGSPAPLSVAPGNATAGDLLTIVSLSQAASWSVSDGAVSAYSMADEVPGAGQGYRVIRFTPAGDGSSGGILLDARGNALGLIAGPGFAVPLASVQGLAGAAPVKTFASGAALKLPENAAANRTHPEKAVAVARAEPAPAAAAIPAAGSIPKERRDRRAIVHNLKTIYVDAEGAKTFGNAKMKAALLGDRLFARLNLEIVDDREAADAILNVRHSLFTDYPFELRSRDNLLLLTGTALGYTSDAGARDVALLFSQMANEYRPAPKQRK